MVLIDFLFTGLPSTWVHVWLQDCWLVQNHLCSWTGQAGGGTGQGGDGAGQEEHVVIVVIKFLTKTEFIASIQEK